MYSLQTDPGPFDASRSLPYIEDVIGSWSLLPRLACLLVALNQAGAPSASPSVEEIKARLQAYERQAAGGRTDPQALGAIARMVVARALESRKFEVWSEACLSGMAPESARCEERWLAVLRSKGAPLRERSAAGSALAQHGNATAASEYFALVKDLPVKDLAAIPQDLRALPLPQATPLFLRLLESTESSHQVAACRELGTIDSGEVRQALQATIGRAVPGLPAWNMCMVARARLREPDAVLKISGFSAAMEGEDLLLAAIVMLEVGNEQGDFLLRKVARDAPPVVRVLAAEQLVQTDPAYAARYADDGVENADPRVRAEALVLERRLGRRPSVAVRSRLVDADELVQIRAAIALLDWISRQKAAKSR